MKSPLRNWRAGAARIRGVAARAGPAYLLAALLLVAAAWPATVAAQNPPRDVADIQSRLLALGYEVGVADGLMGPKTREALRAFQGDRGLPATGRPDEATLEALFAASVPTPPETPPVTPGDDPPSLDAVPLKPVETVPLKPVEPEVEAPVEAPVEAGPRTPLADRDRHAGPSAEADLAARPSAAGPAASAEPDAARSEPDAAAGPEQQSDWVIWAAGVLGVLGVLVFFAAIGRRSAEPKTARRAPPRPMPSDVQGAAPTPRRGHVFGVDVPPTGDRG